MVTDGFVKNVMRRKSMKGKDLIDAPEVVEYPEDFVEGSIEYELITTLKNASEYLGYGRMQFLGHVEEIVDLIYDDKDEQNKKHVNLDDLPF
jgi:hypothetical protein